MRISDWSSDVCSSDLLETALAGDAARALRMSASLCAEGDSVLALMGWVAGEVRRIAAYAAVAASGGDVGAAMRADRVWESRDRKSGGAGKSVSVRVTLGGSPIFNKKKSKMPTY